MATVNPDIFKAYDIRGLYSRDFDETFAQELGNKMSAYFGGTLVVGHDGRQSSDVLQAAVIEGARRAGASVVDVGESTTPLFYYAVRMAGAEGGVMVTASHNPGEYNGFKVILNAGTIIGGVELHSILERNELRDIPGGKVRHEDFSKEYAQKILEVAHVEKLEQTVGFQAPRAMKKILDIIAVHTKIHFVENTNGPLTAVFDPDGDRILFLEHGKKVPADFIFLILTERLKFSTVVHGITFSRAVHEEMHKAGIIAIPSKIGRLFIYENMKAHDADFGGETSGHFYFKAFNYLEAPELALLYMLNIMRTEGKSLRELIAPYQRYFKSEEISFPINRAVFSTLEQKYQNGTMNKKDGLTVEYPDWWFNVRFSNTEPLMRLVVEANTEDLLNQKIAELRQTIGI